MNAGKRIVVLTCAICAVSAYLSGDVVYLKGGKKQVGVVIDNRAGGPTLTIHTSGGELTIPRAKVEKIDSETPGLGYARIGDQFLESRDYTRAGQYYRKALETEKTNDAIRGKLQQVEAALGQLDQARAQDALNAAIKTIHEAEELARQKQFEEANARLRSVDQGETSPLAGQLKRVRSEVFYLWGVDRADRQDPAGAAEKFQAALRLDPNKEVARQQLARVWEGDPTKLQEVVAFYRNSTAPEDRLKLAEAYFKSKDYQAALPIYLQLFQNPASASQAMRDRICLMFDMIHRQYAEKGDFARAYEAYRSFLEFSPEEDPVPLARYEYMIQVAKTDPGDLNARVRNAEFAEQKGLVATAKEEYRNILTMDLKNQKALDGLKRFADEDLQTARDFFTEQQYALSMQQARETARLYPMFPEIGKQAQELVTKAELEQQKIAKNAQQQAVALALRGNDYYNQALAYISAYTSKDVNPSVRVFSPKIEAKKYLERALSCWRTALSMDPSLGSPTSYDLNQKIADAYGKYVVIANPRPVRLPTRDLDRTHRGSNTVNP